MLQIVQGILPAIIPSYQINMEKVRAVQAMKHVDLLSSTLFLSANLHCRAGRVMLNGY